MVYDPATGWLDETVFVDSPTSEATTRSLLQRLFTQIQTFTNDTLIVWINATFATKADLTGITQGAVADDSITDAKLATDAKVGSLATLTTTAKTSIVAAINELVTSIAACYTTALHNTFYDEDIGKIEYFAMQTPPNRRLECNGSAVSRTTYAKLFTAIGTTYGVGDGSTTFNLPDLRGVFPRGWDNGKGYDTGRTFGSYQADDNKAHTHTGTTASDGAHTHAETIYNPQNYGGTTRLAGSYNGANDRAAYSVASGGAHTHTFTTASTGATEVKVKNVALLVCIKY
jgi:microcystin-dependent protein